jgi:hypothetical protein
LNYTLKRFTTKAQREENKEHKEEKDFWEEKNGKPDSSA